jgi:uncharacterized protein (TIGR00369 family)
MGGTHPDREDEERQRTADRAARALWKGDAASQRLGMTVDSCGPGRAAVSMHIRPDMVNGHRICHGGLVFALADSAFAFACNSYGDNTVAAGAAIVTNHSLPEIGDAFGGRDHTTVLHACRKVAELRDSSSDMGEDHKNLTRLLSS